MSLTLFSAQLLRSINKNFSSFRKIYLETGAPYTTQLKVSRFIDILLAKCGAFSENIPKK